jgi:3-hydroxybenzoate 6-monooxygenase
MWSDKANDKAGRLCVGCRAMRDHTMAKANGNDRVQLMARVYGEFYHAAGVTAELRNQMLGGRTVEQAYDGMAWLYGGM